MRERWATRQFITKKKTGANVKRNVHVRRFLISLGISVVLNVSLFGLATVVNSHGTLESILNVIASPGIAFATSIIPSGHNLSNFVGIPLIAFIFLAFFYGLPVWLLAEIWAKFHRSSLDPLSITKPPGT